MSNKNEKIDHPNHYNSGEYEVIDVIDDWGYTEGFCLGNVLKYLGRCNHKENKLDDLQKAKWYLDYYIEKLKEKERES